jgi:hypothetical protein
MPTPHEFDSLATTTHLAEAEHDAFGPDFGRPDLGDPDDGVYAEITERRAQLENADILRGARAL